jgi:hypothetical protein
MNGFRLSCIVGGYAANNARQTITLYPVFGIRSCGVVRGSAAHHDTTSLQAIYDYYREQKRTSNKGGSR